MSEAAEGHCLGIWASGPIAIPSQWSSGFIWGGVGQIGMQGGYAGDEGVTLQASKPFIDPLDEEARNSGLITQGEKSAWLNPGTES